LQLDIFVFHSVIRVQLFNTGDFSSSWLAYISNKSLLRSKNHAQNFLRIVGVGVRTLLTQEILPSQQLCLALLRSSNTSKNNYIARAVKLK